AIAVAGAISTLVVVASGVGGPAQAGVAAIPATTATRPRLVVVVVVVVFLTTTPARPADADDAGDREHKTDHADRREDPGELAGDPNRKRERGGEAHRPWRREHR